MVEADAKLQVRVGGLGDLDGDERTLSQEALDKINQVAREDLRKRYTDIGLTDEIHILAITSPNIAIVKQSEDE